MKYDKRTGTPITENDTEKFLLEKGTPLPQILNTYTVVKTRGGSVMPCPDCGSELIDEGNETEYDFYCTSCGYTCKGEYEA